MSYRNNRTERKSFRVSEQTARIIPSLCQAVSANSTSQLSEVAIVMLAISIGKMTSDEAPLSIKPIVDNIENNLLVKNSNENISTEYLSSQRVGWLDRELREIEKICYVTRDMVMNMLPSAVLIPNEQLAEMPNSFKSADPRLEDEKHYFAVRSEQNFKECIRRNQINRINK